MSSLGFSLSRSASTPSFMAVCYMKPLHFNEGEMVLFHLEEVLSTSRHFNGFPFCSLD